MTLATMLLLWAVMIFTAVLSGIFGMAGGLVLMGVLLVLLPLPDAMALHGVTQMASNGWRGALWVKHVRWRIVAPYLLGCAAAVAVWSLLRFVPDKALSFLALGLVPFGAKLLPKGLRANPESAPNAAGYGVACMSLILLTGVAGPLLDSFFLGGRLDRREIVATKAMVQVVGHAAKLLYFGGLIDQAASLDPVLAVGAVICSVVGTTAARPILEKLSNDGYRLWARRIVTTICAVYVAQGLWLLVTG
jgi:uncharacterized membrane protein YfcA